MVDYLLLILIIIIIILIGYIFNFKKNKYIMKHTKFIIYNKAFELNDKNENLICNNIITNDDLGLLEKEIYSKISKLRNYEYNIVSKKKKISMDDYILNNSILKSIYVNIYKYINNIINIIPILDELIERQTFYYRFMNTKQVNQININYSDYIISIPVIEVAKHHHAVEWVYKLCDSDNIGTILHVDSHADMNPIKNDINFTKLCIKKKLFSKKNLKRIYDSVTNIGSVLVPFVAPYNSNNGIVWLTPEWVTEPFCQSENIISTSYDYCCFYGKAPIYYPNLLHEYKKINNNPDTPISIITTNIKESSKVIKQISNNYILNIDLDYFVTYGNDNYKETGDAISHNRTIFDYGYILKTDNYTFEKTKQLLQFEMNLIRERIDKFLVLIKKLKDNGKIPKMIIICDSTRIHFSHEYLGQEFIQYNESQLINEFTPKYLTYWIHNTILHHLNLIMA